MPKRTPRKRVAKKWIRGQVDRVAISQGCYFDAEAGQRVCDFIERFCRQNLGPKSGQRIELMEWQRDWLMRLFGWKRKDGTRRYRRAYLEVAKKNGKSTLVSALLLYLLLADAEGGPRIFINACDREQALMVYDEAAGMVEMSPALAARVTIGRSKHVIRSPRNNGTIRANSADAPTKDGANASAWIFDEIHRQPDRALYDVFRYAGDARDQPLEITITTAGEDTTGIWYELRELSNQINAGAFDDISHLGVVYAADQGDDIDDPKTWAKANPSLGKILSYERFKDALEDAKRTPGQFANFLRLKLGIVTSDVAKFLDLEDWKACGGPLRDLAGRTGYGGLDLSSILDLTAWVMLFPDPDGTFDVLFRCWTPAEGVAKRERADKATYKHWIETGELEATPGRAIDYATVQRAVVEDCQRYKIKSVFCDPWNAEKPAQDLAAQKIPIQFLRQGQSLNSPTKELQRVVVSNLLRHGGHKVATWCASNAVTVTDVHQNIMLSKKRSREKIDLLAALVNAFAAYTADAITPAPVYEKRGIRRL